MQRLLVAVGVVTLSVCPAAVAPAADIIPPWAQNRDVRLPNDRAGHLAKLGVGSWHAAGYLGKGVKVAVLDSGFRGYREQVGKSLPADLLARSARRDADMEFKDSQHGILCGEVVHAVAPDAGVLFANWDADNPESFLDAVRWAKGQGAKVISCSVVMPSWSDGEGNGPIHRRLSELIGDGSKPDDVLFFSCAGNTAQRHWAGTFTPDAGGYHVWSGKTVLNAIEPWGTERVSLELCWSDPDARYRVEIVDPLTGKAVDGCTYRAKTDPYSYTARFVPKAGQNYAARVVQEAGKPGKPGKFHFNSLAAFLSEVRLAGSIPFPGDGPEVITVGATTLDDQRASFSACGPNSDRPKPDVVAPIPFGTFLRDRPFSGTSCATPQAAAVAALCWARQPDATAAQVRAYVTTRARDLGPTGHDTETGYGTVHLPDIAPAPHVASR